MYEYEVNDVVMTFDACVINQILGIKIDDEGVQYYLKEVGLIMRAIIIKLLLGEFGKV